MSREDCHERSQQNSGLHRHGQTEPRPAEQLHGAGRRESVGGVRCRFHPARVGQEDGGFHGHADGELQGVERDLRHAFGGGALLGDIGDGEFELVGIGGFREALIDQRADLFASVIDASTTVRHTLAEGRKGWVQVARGSLVLNGRTLEQGDGAALEGPLPVDQRSWRGKVEVAEREAAKKK